MKVFTCHRTGAAVSPARAAVLRDVLVASRAGVVDAVYVPPVPGLRQLSEVQKFMTSCSSERGFGLSLFSFKLSDAWAKSSAMAVSKIQSLQKVMMRQMQYR